VDDSAPVGALVTRDAVFFLENKEPLG
jgi:hypothetical protein